MASLYINACYKRVWKLPYTRLRRSSSVATTSSTMACLSSGIVLIRLRNTRSFRNPHRKKSGTVSSGDRAGQAMSPKREMTVPNIVARSNAPLRLTIWNGVLSSTVPFSANHDKLLRRWNIQFWNVSVGSAPPGTFNLTDTCSDYGIVVLSETISFQLKFPLCRVHDSPPYQISLTDHSFLAIFGDKNSIK